MNTVFKCLALMGLLLGSTHAIAQSTGTVTYVYTDQQGTPLAEADASGNITATFDYAPYGSQALGSPPNGPGYTGHVNDPDTGLVYMQARYYDPSTGRFLSVDPSKPMPGNGFNFSRYAYANNNPIGNTDPTGMDDCGPGCERMRALSDWFDGVGQRLTGSMGQQSGTAPMGQLKVANTYVVGGVYNDLASVSATAAPMADAIPGVTLGACLSGSSCGATDWAMAGLAVVPGEGAEADAAKEAYPYIMAGVHGNSASSIATSYLYRLTSSVTDNLLKWGISKNPVGRYTRGFMTDKDMQIMTSGSRREMLNLERWTVEHDPGPLNRESWAGKQAGDIP